MTNVDNEVQIGERIRARRQQLGSSLRELARKTDLTASFLSQVETGQANPSINSLRRIAEALNVSILFFLQEGLKHDPVVRANRRPKITLSGSKVTDELLTPDMARKLEIFQGTLSPQTGNVARPLREPTEECIIVLSGALDVGLEIEEYTLGPGDSIYFEGHQLRRLANHSKDEEVTWISIITPPAV
jgi:transcriptional regulator with XRE-family HTH domain